MLQKLRKSMQLNNIDAYIIMSDDYHQSEYSHPYFKSRAAVTKFTGSAGYCIVTMDKAILWTDGRYFIQANKELKNSGFELYKMGIEGFDTIEEFIQKNINENKVLAFDGRTMPIALGKKLENISKKNNFKINSIDLISDIWDDRPEFPTDKIFMLDLNLSGKDFTDKLNDVRNTLKEKNAKYHILSCLDDICWLLNIRGNDIPNCPFVFSYVIISDNSFDLFIDLNKLNNEQKTILKNKNVNLHNYNDFYDFLNNINFDSNVLIDPVRCNYHIYNIVKNKLSNTKYELIESTNPTIILKAIKNDVEIENIRKIHIQDSVAVTKFMIWIKENVGKIEMDELSVEKYLYKLREEQPDFYELSFDTISAYGANAAMMHYKATEQSYSKIEPKGLYLIDSGGQYYGGTTDITRTFALGELTEEEKYHFTLTVKSVINLSKVKFLYGCSGLSLDVLARSVMWNQGLDYKCGTGHGVGYMLNVHEAPNGFRWKIVPERTDSAILEANMVTTIEPGVYIEGKHGIRIENETITKIAFENENGKFMEFETITFAPIDLDAINISMLTDEEKIYLNNFHKQSYEKLSPYLNEHEKEKLRHYTREI